MAFKVVKDSGANATKTVSFRFPESLLDELKEIADKEEISLTDLVKQMLQYCVTEYGKGKK